jgi:urease accessory protein
MATEDLSSRLLFLLHTADSIYPTGTYAHSFGLEGLVQLGVIANPATFEEYLQKSAVPALAHVELPLVRLAHDAAAARDAGAIRDLAELSGALKGARELREASARVGGQRLALAADLIGHPFLKDLRAQANAGAWVPHANVVFGLETAAGGATREDAAAAYAYVSLAGAVAAAMKLIRLGQNAAQRILRRALDRAPAAVAASAAVDRADIGWFTPLLDIAGARHETGVVRIFIS